MDRVLIFIPTLTAGGAERVASVIANEWAGTREVILVTYFSDAQFFHVDPRVRVICLDFIAGRGSMGRSIDVLRAVLRFRDLVKAVQPKFVLSFMNKYNAFAIASLRGTNIPVIVSERGSPAEILPRLRVFARDHLYRYAAGVVCQTRAGRDFIHDRIPVPRICVLPNPVTRIIDPHERLPDKTIISVGRLIPSKAFDQLISAFAIMKGKDWRLVICGEGPMRMQLVRQAFSLGVGDRVDFPGEVRDLRPYFRKAGIFAFSSIHEGFPNALAEAVVSGLPCVSYDCPTGPSDLITDGVTGRLLPVGDWRLMAEVLGQLISDPKLANSYGARAAELAETLNPRRVALDYLRFCEETASLYR